MQKLMTILVVLLVLLVPVASVPAQDAALRARERAQMLTDFRAMLEHTDATTRMAAFEEAMGSKDQALITMAMDVALGGTDANLKTAALRAYFHGRAAVPVTVILPERPSDAQQGIHGRMSTLVLQQVTVQGTAVSGRANMYGTISGSLVSNGMNLRLGPSGTCSLTARVANAKQMAGRLDCQIGGNEARAYKVNRVEYPITIDLP